MTKRPEKVIGMHFFQSGACDETGGSHQWPGYCTGNLRESKSPCDRSRKIAGEGH